MSESVGLLGWDPKGEFSLLMRFFWKSKEKVFYTAPYNLLCQYGK
jgi:hypothetical protein